ncbi:hypothetical protein [Streptomyces californicus]|uniref:hypothetical protein n=1 Tax=Streptomyces californicus TaxID=67351 RepID=UPI0033283448
MHRVTGEDARTPQIVDLVLRPEGDVLPNGEYGAVTLPLLPENDMAPRLVIGQVAKAAQGATCTWKDGTSTKVGRSAVSTEANADVPVIHSLKDSPYDWFVCLAPESTAYEEIRVTK